MHSELTGRAKAVRERFTALNFHDCRVLEIGVTEHSESSFDIVRLKLEMIAGAKADQWRPAILTFRECAGLYLKVDFWGKRVCQDAIADTSCELLGQNTDLLDTDDRRLEEQPLVSLLDFTISLCPPGGEIRVIAADFSLTDIDR